MFFVTFEMSVDHAQETNALKILTELFSGNCAEMRFMKNKKIVALCLSIAVAAGWSGTSMTAMASGTTESSGASSTSVETAAAESETAADTNIQFVDPGMQSVIEAQQAAQAISDEQTDEVLDAISIPTEEEMAVDMSESAIQATFDDTYQFRDVELTMYLTADTNVVDAPNEEAEVVDTLTKYGSITVTGTNAYTYWEVNYRGKTAYIDSTVLTGDEAVIEEMKEEDVQRIETEEQQKAEQAADISEKTESVQSEWSTALEQERASDIANQTRNPNWSGAVLSKSKGSVYGPSGKETYYNLNMSGCVANMNRRGYYAEVWVRNDGCKMFGDYIMCAANLSVHPYGSLVESSLGTCIVVDTGGFASSNPNQLDIAVTW